MANDGSVEIKIIGDDSDLQKKLNSIGAAAQKAAKVAVAAFAAVGTALVGAGAYAVKVGADFEAGMSKVSAISGATGEELEQLEAKAKAMGATTKFSATESAEALQYMAMAGWKTQQMVDGLPGIMNLAAASGEDLASVSDIVTDALTAFGLAASDSAHFADVLAKASSSSNTNVAMMGATFKYAAPLAGAMGYSIEDTALAIGLMANAGIKGEQAGTALRSMFTRLANPPKDAAAAIEALGLKMTDASGAMLPLSDVLGQMREKFAGLSQEQQVQMASSLAGQEAMSGLLAIVNASASDYDNLAAAIQSADGAAKQQADTMNDNLKGALTLLGSNLEGVGIQVYESLETPLKQAVQSANGSITTLSNSLSKGQLKTAMDTISKAIGDIVSSLGKFAAAAIPKAITAVANLCKNGDRLVTVLKTAAIAFVGLKVASTANALLREFSRISQMVTVALKAETIALTAKQLAVGVLTGQIGLATAAQTAWNTVIMANPVGAVIVAVTLLTAGLVALKAATDTETAAEKAAREEREKLIQSIDDRTAAAKELQTAAREQLDTSLTEIDVTEAQVREFESLIDSNGRVKSGYEGRAAVLEKLINEAIPGAISKTDEETGTYYNLSDAIEETIRLKRAQAVLDANQEQYNAAQAGIVDAEKERYQIQQKRNDALEKQEQIESEIEAFKNASTFNEADYDQMKLALEEQKQLVSDLSGKYTEADDTVSGYYKTISNYEGVLAAMEQGGEALEQALNKVQYSFKTAGTATAGELQAQADELGGIYQDMLARYQSGESDITEAQVNNMRAMWESAGTELKTAQENLMTEWSASIAAGQPQVETAIQLVAQGVVSAADITAQMQEHGYTVTSEFAGGIAAAEALASGNAAQVEAMCEAALNGDTTTYGYDFMRGFLEAILASNPSEEVRAMVQAALDAIPETQVSGSPSKITEGYGGDFADGYAGGITDGAGAAETAAGSMAGQAIAKLLGIAPQAQAGGTQAATHYSTGMRSGVTGAVEAAILLATGASGAAKGKAGEFSTVGGELSASLKSGIDGGAQAVSTAMDTVAAGAKASAAKVASAFHAVGANMARGLMNGISSMARSVANAAASLAKGALDAAKHAVNIQSPSRDFREKVGRMMGMGMALGIGDSKDTVRSNVALLSRHALEDAREHAKSFQDIGSLYVENLTYGVGKGRDAALSKFERWLDADVEKLGTRDDATDEQKKSYEDAAKEIMSAYKDALNDGYDEALSTVKTRVNELTAEFQAAHDDLLRQQESMQKKLSGFGDLFTIGKNGDLSLGKIEDNIEAVKRYDDALTELQSRGVSEDFMQQVTGLGVEEGAKFAEKLNELAESRPEQFDKYVNAWQEQQDLAKEVAEKFYADQLETLENDFTGKLSETLESVPNLLTDIGKDSIQGMIDGMYSKEGALSAAAREIIGHAIQELRAAADMHSPSRKTRDLVGKPLAEGIAVGFDKQMGDVYRQISRTLDGEVLKLSADVKVQAERQAAQASPAPVQTVYKTTHTDRVVKIGVDERALNGLGRAFFKAVKIEDARQGGSMAKGGGYA